MAEACSKMILRSPASSPASSCRRPIRKNCARAEMAASELFSSCAISAAISPFAASRSELTSSSLARSSAMYLAFASLMRRSGTNRKDQSVVSDRHVRDHDQGREKEERHGGDQRVVVDVFLAPGLEELPARAHRHRSRHQHGVHEGSTTTEAPTHGRMSASVNTAEPEWPWVQSGSPPAPRYATPAADRASTFCPALKSAL